MRYIPEGGTEKKIFFLVLSIIVLSLTTTVFSYDLAQCIKQNNIFCENCVAVTINIMPAEIKDSIVVGDHYEYSINLTNLGNSTLNSSFYVRVLNPSYQLQDSAKYEGILIPVAKERILFPRRQQNQVDTFDLGLSGSNVINLSSDKEVMFYRFYDDCSYISDRNSYWYYFEAMPRWQYEWNKKLEGWQKTSEVLSTNTQNLAENTENLTYVLIILTLMLIIIAIREDIAKIVRKRKP
jgi:hypothetical protein